MVLRRRRGPSPYDVMHNKSLDVGWMGRKTQGPILQKPVQVTPPEAPEAPEVPPPEAPQETPEALKTEVKPQKNPRPQIVAMEGGSERQETIKKSEGLKAGVLQEKLPEVPGVSETPKTPGGGLRSWLREGQLPKLVQLHQWAAILIVAGVVGLVVLAYWAGRHRGAGGFENGVSAGDGGTSGASGGGGGGRVPAAQVVVSYGATKGLPREIKGRQEGVAAEAPAAAKPVDQYGVAAVGDPRQEGYNYFVLAHYPAESASKLVEFLDQNGVDAAAFRAQGKSQFQVVALRGFLKEELEGQAYEQYKQKLMQLGHLWHSQGLGPKFSGIYPSLFMGESDVEMIRY